MLYCLLFLTIRPPYSSRDQIFKSFCKKIGVVSIRDYEDGPLRKAKELSSTLTRLDEMISKIKADLEVAQSENIEGKIKINLTPVKLRRP